MFQQNPRGVVCRVGRACCIVVRKELIDWIVLLFFFKVTVIKEKKSKYSPRLLSFFLMEIASRNCLRLTVYFYQSPYQRKGITSIIKKRKTHHLLCQVFQSLCPHSCFLESSNLVHSLLFLNLLKFLLSSEHLSFLSFFIESLLFSFQILLLL